MVLRTSEADLIHVKARKRKPHFTTTQLPKKLLYIYIWFHKFFFFNRGESKCTVDHSWVTRISFPSSQRRCSRPPSTAKQLLLTKMTPPMESNATQTIATIAFGIVATLLGAFTIWQGREAWRRLYGDIGGRPSESDPLEVDIESRDSPCHDWSLKRLTNRCQKPLNSKHVQPPIIFLNFQQLLSRTSHHWPRRKRRDISVRSQFMLQLSFLASREKCTLRVPWVLKGFGPSIASWRR